MTDENKEYADQLKADGIDIETDTQEEVITDESISGKFEDIKNPADEADKDDEEDKADESKVDKTEDKPDEPDPSDKSKDDDSTLTTQKPFKKRSIYDEYKDKKHDLKAEKDLREAAEKERDELQVKLDKLSDNPNSSNADKKEALDKIDEFAKRINADPDTIREMKTLFLEGSKFEIDDTLKKDLEDFKSFKQNSDEAFARQAFSDEFNALKPQLKTDFPTASEEEIAAIESKLDELSHNKDFHDKTLDYVVFKNKEELSALVSPKKKGMETKERNDVNTGDFKFDPNADLSKLSAKDQELWQKHYGKITSADELADDPKGGKIII